MSDKTCGVDFLAGFLVGAMVGAAAALLFAPQSGEETRTIIRDKGIELKERADDLGTQARQRADVLQSQAKERAADLSTQAKGRAEGLQAKVKEAIDEGKAAAAQKKEDMLSQLEGQQAAGQVEAEA